jgi:hypothetical protein
MMLDRQRLTEAIESLQSQGHCEDGTCLGCLLQKEIVTYEELYPLFENLIYNMRKTCDPKIIVDSFICGFELCWSYLKSEELEKLTK